MSLHGAGFGLWTFSMCGIAGIFNFNGPAPDQDILRRMAGAIVHRGPDDEGFFIDGPVGLAFRRLSIIDLATGRQPLSNEAEDGRYTIIFNGEIYNYPELRQRLERTGHRFHTKSDTETILHLYEEKKERCLDDLVGMFALAIWDRLDRRLFLARDRLGKKPLYYAQSQGQFIFASEIKSLLEHPNLKDPAIDPRALDHYLTYQAIASPLTIYQGIMRLPPACFLMIKAGHMSEPREYWRLNFEPKFQGSPEEAKIRILELLRQTTKERLISEVPLGAFLSGGVDSSAVVAMMSEVSSSSVKTYTVGFDEEDLSEAQAGRELARRYGCDHHEFTVKADMTKVLPKIIWHYDQPFADSSALPSYFVARETRKSVTVALNGDGGDEAFGGYLRYAADAISMKLNSWLPARAMSAAGQAASRFAARDVRAFRYAKRLLEAWDPNLLETNFRLFHYFNASQKRQLYRQSWQENLSLIQGREHMDRLASLGQFKDPMDIIFYIDYRGYLPDCLLVKMDIASMANSLEARSPFLDHRLVEFAAALPSAWKIKGKTTKWILRETLREKVPDFILKRRKTGFGAPVDRWLRRDLGPIARQILLGPRAVQRPYFNNQEIVRLLSEHERRERNHGNKIWALLCFELWHQIYRDKTLKPSDPLEAAQE
ncbi:MAG: asparagine synthase (glutamine-hydrolyzing) [Elusimicrobia bacterium]|nr:asparagine synthase (glutamine-hydrolyzing) [Elusimicrobiota bacterium]